jgi:hypothetical protein
MKIKKHAVPLKSTKEREQKKHKFKTFIFILVETLLAELTFMRQCFKIGRRGGDY